MSIRPIRVELTKFLGQTDPGSRDVEAAYCEWSLPTLSGEGSSVPSARATLMQTRAFCVNGPSIWNGLPLELRLLSRRLSDTFCNRLKTVPFDRAESGAPLSNSGLEEAL